MMMRGNDDAAAVELKVGLESAEGVAPEPNASAVGAAVVSPARQHHLALGVVLRAHHQLQLAGPCTMPSSLT